MQNVLKYLQLTQLQQKSWALDLGLENEIKLCFMVEKC